MHCLTNVGVSLGYRDRVGFTEINGNLVGGGGGGTLPLFGVVS